MKPAALQCDIRWADPLFNISRFGRLMEAFLDSEEPRPDIFVLPEMFSSGFTMDPKMASFSPEVLCWMRNFSSDHGVALTGSLPVGEEGCFYNRSYFIAPDGEEHHYDKRHLFRMSGEGDLYSPGNRKCVLKYRGTGIALNVCYDLRFPAWSRNDGSYDLMINVASWPSRRIKVAETLSSARAIENQCYFLFCNRTGRSPEEKYNGHTALYDFKGNSIGKTVSVEGMRRGERFVTADLDLEKLSAFRQKFPAWMDADRFEMESCKDLNDIR